MKYMCKIYDICSCFDEQFCWYTAFGNPETVTVAGAECVYEDRDTLTEEEYTNILKQYI